MKNGIWILGLLFLAGVCGAAEDANTPDVILKTRMDAVFKVLQNKDLSTEQRDQRITKIVTPMFDFDAMAVLTIKNHKNKFSAQTFSQFKTLFVERLKDSYRDKLTLYTDEQIVFKKTETIKNRTLIYTNIIGQDKPIEVIYKFIERKNHWKIYDVEIKGISILTTYRTQFDEILSEGGVEELLKQLAQPVVEDEQPQT